MVEWPILHDQLRSGEPARRSIRFAPALMTEIKFYGRHKSGSIDSDAAVIAMSTRLPKARSEGLSSVARLGGLRLRYTYRATRH
jgi:hypothetical protein